MSTTPLLNQLRADIQQLTEPYYVAAGRRIVAHPPLLDQLRAAAQPRRGGTQPQRHARPGSRPPAALNPLDAMATLTYELGAWRTRLALPTPPQPRIVHGCAHHTCQQLLAHRRNGPWRWVHDQVSGPPCPHAARRHIHIDGQRDTLRQLPPAAEHLDPPTLRWLATEVHDWWTMAAHCAGWTTRECLNVRSA